MSHISISHINSEMFQIQKFSKSQQPHRVKQQIDAFDSGLVIDMVNINI